MSAVVSKEQLEERVRKVVSSQLQVEDSEIQSESLFVDDLGADSLDLTELAIAFEDEFDLEIPDSDFGQLSTLAGVVSYLQNRLK